MASRRRCWTQILLAALLCVSSVHFAAPAQAETLSVCPSGCAFTTIASALEDADDGDTIVIEEGTYSGGVEVSRNVRIFGRGRDKTTIMGTNRASVIRVRRGANVQITAVTITGGGGSPVGSNDNGGGGILNEGKLTLLDSSVRGNSVAGAESRGGGLYSDSSKTLEIFRTIFSGNKAARGGGIFIREGEVFISDSTVSGNVAEKNGGGIAHVGGERLQLRQHSIIRDNRAVVGGGVSVVSRLEIYDTTVSGNKALFGGGVASGSQKPLQVVNSTISGNTGDTLGGGIFVGDAGAELIDSTVERNQSPLGAGLHTTAGDVSLNRLTISANVAATDGGGIFTRGAELDLSNSKVIDNRAGQRGGGIFVDAGGSVRLRQGSVVSGNQPDQCFGAPCLLRVNRR